ncbi:hypothetical protein BCR33DRAFT_828949 [Rhizoclosmatium globosum]|uniref:Uncharacterized protein n=1 Tax=Rhizoclosmatium globosum TaxID=329046 RepID=A0A1Y2BYR3_9FUNG|nr:hypothetical protein BCR33DRAFT_828949 [Rhizoclosmatium globosum]|eukprot:ORY39891.1 hypothetical protein BCR33DRAFT_828949 [Rhizoclosmatium globosum]
MSSGSWKRPGRPGNGLSPTNRSWANGPIGDRLMDILRKRLEKGIKTTPAAFKKEADGAEFKNYHTKTLGVVINEMLRKLQRDINYRPGQSFQDGSLFGMQPLAPVDFNAGSSSNLQQSVADSNENDKDFENEMDEDFDEEFYDHFVTNKDFTDPASLAIVNHFLSKNIEPIRTRIHLPFQYNQPSLKSARLSEGGVNYRVRVELEELVVKRGVL